MPKQESAQLAATLEARPKRMTLSDVVERLLTRGGQGSASSVSLTRNAKGQTQIEVTVRAGETEEFPTAAEAQAEAERMYDALCAKYPTAEGYPRNDADAGAAKSGT
jgi:hypothetical protein